ncbi:uncharacterized protein BT62DRAFT_932382 [Guyanagaster necrorhizus]|uniref:Uncharacterized protein n=1 Tax=Guyanagaster necrorhizus TaxID=856835 RepID=A0A9P7VSI8_9AGAR|nr:uncharacterized protein BT62DRAFT_932382 [Guyanagaster necrorhizus MCA 3950]KAG7446042.1 hypothetical protein BT62DRAFT_932382 [Guyanagaster necrorhizus MCA 3950]
MPLRRQNAMLNVCALGTPALAPPSHIVRGASNIEQLVTAMDNTSISSAPPPNAPLKKSLYKAKRGLSNPKATSKRKALPLKAEYSWIVTDPWIYTSYIKSGRAMCVGCGHPIQFSDSISSCTAREEWFEHKMNCKVISLQKTAKQQFGRVDFQG